jgi:hypothetical protein
MRLIWQLVTCSKVLDSEVIDCFTVFRIRRNCLGSGRSLLLYIFIERVIRQTVVIIEAYQTYHLHEKCYPALFCHG